MARLFAAIELDAAARECVALEQRRLAGRIPTESLRWVRLDHALIESRLSSADPSYSVRGTARLAGQPPGLN